MFTCRKELEEILGLRHPRKVLIEESMEIPRTAERFFRGIYAEPEKLKRGFAELQRETDSVAELISLRRKRLQDWAVNLPESSSEVQEYIKETALELRVRQERADSTEAKVLSLLRSQEDVRLFPIEEESLGKWSGERILLFPKVINKTADLCKLSPEHLNKVVLVHFMAHVLVYAGEDKDKKVWTRVNSDGLETLLHYYCRIFYKQFQYKEILAVEKVFTKCLPETGVDTHVLDEYTREQINAALIFWRRRADLGWQETLDCLQDFT